MAATPAADTTSPEAYHAMVKMESSTDHGVSESRAQVELLHAQWQTEHDPAKRSDVAAQLVEAVIHDFGEQPVEIADEVARDGLPQKVLPIPPASKIRLRPVFVLPGVHRDEMDAPDIPVFRRIAATRFEAWTPKEGWLFDAKGRVLADVHVPRRDGNGRDWLGAFLPDGRWITTDLWANDRQLTLFDQQGDPRWELPGRDAVAAINRLNQPAYASDSPEPSCGWARADRTGREWLVSFGTDWARGLALITPARKIVPLRNDTEMWRLVYPRSMAYRGMFTSLFIDSDDGALTLSRDAAGHGIGVGWPAYSLKPSKFQAVISQGEGGFGFWPQSHDVYIHSGSWDVPDRVWFFDVQGRYQGEVPGRPLADAANGRDLLTLGANGVVATLRRGAPGPAVTAARLFTWADGSPAVPLALYDDLKRGFFLRGPGTLDPGSDGLTDRGTAEIVLAGWDAE